MNNNTHLHKSLAALAAAGLALGGAHSAGAQRPPGPTAVRRKTDQALTQTLRSGAHTGWTAAIVRTTGVLSAAQAARMTALGADVTRRLPLIGSVALRLPTHNLAKLAALPFVSHLSFDGQVKKCDEFTVASSGAGYAYANYGLDGTGVTVAVVDSGITQSADLATASGASRDLADVNFVPATGNSADNTTTDLCGHGTHVAGSVGGNGANSSGKGYTRTFYGIARNVNLVNVRVLDHTGQGSVSQVVSGLQWVVANKAKYNIRVLNLSLGHPVGECYMTDPLCQAVEAA